MEVSGGRNDSNQGESSPFFMADEESSLLDGPKKRSSAPNKTSSIKGSNNIILSTFWNLIVSTPAVILLAAYNGMLSVPFGSSYFSQSVPMGEAERQALGMRMSFLALFVGQFVMGVPGTSTLALVTVWQLGELAPFYHSFADFAASHYEPEAILPTTLYLMSVSTLTVGLSFYIVGKLGAGRLTSFFPTHVVLGFVAGIGVWAIGMSVTVSSSPSASPEAEVDDTRNVANGVLGIPFLLSAAATLGIRILRWLIPREKFMLLDPVYFLSIPFLFYAVIYALGMNYNKAVHLGLLFRNPNEDSISSTDQSPIFQVLQIWTSFDISKVYWTSIFNAAPQLLASAVLAIFLVCPFIPPLAIFLGQETDFSMDQEFIAHGYANCLSAILSPGGLAMCLCYSSTVLFTNAGAKRGYASMILLALANFAVLIYGPIAVEYIPRCLAGSLLLDMGVSLFMEGVLDHDQKFDQFEIASIWAVMIIMNVIDMTAGLITGLAMSLFTFAVQASLTSGGRGGPIRQAMDCSNLPSGRWRSPKAAEILDDPVYGRSRIAVFQLQGNLFFGNAPALQEQVIAFLKKKLEEKDTNGGGFLMVVLDFTLVVGIDASAATTIDKLQDFMKKKLGVSTVLSVAPLSEDDIPHSWRSERPGVNTSFVRMDTIREGGEGIIFSTRRADETLRRSAQQRRPTLVIRGEFDPSTTVSIDGNFYHTLDEALSTCEDMLLNQRKPGIGRSFVESLTISNKDGDSGLLEHREAILALKHYLTEEDERLLEEIYSKMERRQVQNGAVLLAAGEVIDTIYLLVRGEFIAHRYVREDMDMSWKHNLDTGICVGLPSMVLRQRQLMTIRCVSSDNVVYALTQANYEALVEESPRVARVLDLALARTLALSLRILSNRLYQ